MSTLADTDRAMRQHRHGVMRAKDVLFWRRQARAARAVGDRKSAWSCEYYARNHEAAVRLIADSILAELKREGGSRTTPPVPKIFSSGLDQAAPDGA